MGVWRWPASTWEAPSEEAYQQASSSGEVSRSCVFQYGCIDPLNKATNRGWMWWCMVEKMVNLCVGGQQQQTQPTSSDYSCVRLSVEPPTRAQSVSIWTCFVRGFCKHWPGVGVCVYRQAWCSPSVERGGNQLTDRFVWNKAVGTRSCSCMGYCVPYLLLRYCSLVSNK